MASKDQIRRYVAWYAAALAAAAQAIDEGKEAGEVIRAAVDGLSDADARNVLQVIIAHQAQRAVTEGKLAD
jgi:cytochrome c553